MNKPLVRKLRCAVYTRKSSEEGLDMDVVMRVTASCMTMQLIQEV